MESKLDNTIEKDKIIEKLQTELEKEKSKRRRRTIIFIIVIILLTILYFALYELGKIGYDHQIVASDPYETIKIIKITKDDIEIEKDNRIRHICQ